MVDFIMPIIYPNFMSPEEYFKNISGVQKKYESMKAFFKEKMTAEKIASQYADKSKCCEVLIQPA